jgi:hypothetical protein
MSAWGRNSGVSAQENFTKLCEQIKCNKTSSTSLTILRSKYGSIWENFNCALKLADALANNTSLTELSCLGLNFEIEGCSELAQALQLNKALKTLQIGHEQFGDDQANALLGLGILGVVEHLDLERRSLTKQSCYKLGAAVGHPETCLTTLNLAFNDIDDEGIMLFSMGISTATKLEYLDLKYNQLTCEGSKILAEALIRYGVKLRRLDLSGNERLGAVGVAALAPVTAKELILDGCSGGDAGCAALMLGKPRVVLSLAENDITSAGIRIITQLSFLIGDESNAVYSLNLARNSQIGNGGLAAVCHTLLCRQELYPGSKPIRHLDVSNIGATQIPSLLLSGIVSSLIFIGNGPLNDSDLIAALSLKSTIKSLSLSGTGVTNICAVFKALHFHESLTTVELGGIPLDESARQELAILREVNPKLDVAVDKGVNDN